MEGGTLSSSLLFLWLVFTGLSLASKVALSILRYALDWHVHMKSGVN